MDRRHTPHAIRTGAIRERTRACFRPEPLLFVLDEPTASLDAPSEHAVVKRYVERSKALAETTGAITVIVSHRFSTVVEADLILVMSDSEVAEAGSHESLMAAGGRYAELYAIHKIDHVAP